MAALIADNLAQVREEVAAACDKYGRNAQDVKLIAVTKTVPVESIREAYDCGQRIFGENKAQEALAKIDFLPADVEWHFIGRIQSNKVRKIVRSFSSVHSVDCLEIATDIDRIAAEEGVFPKIFLQINLSSEPTKGGFSAAQVRTQIEQILELPRCELIGLMTIPPPVKEADESRTWFAKLRELRDLLESQCQVRLPYLSMGMSGDFSAAIAEGANYVRVGTAIFGTRAQREKS